MQATLFDEPAALPNGLAFAPEFLSPAPGLAPFLAPLRERVARWLSMGPQDFTHALVSEYRPGTQLGWHRDEVRWRWQHRVEPTKALRYSITFRTRVKGK